MSHLVTEIEDVFGQPINKQAQHELADALKSAMETVKSVKSAMEIVKTQTEKGGPGSEDRQPTTEKVQRETEELETKQDTQSILSEAQPNASAAQPEDRQSETMKVQAETDEIQSRMKPADKAQGYDEKIKQAEFGREERAPGIQVIVPAAEEAEFFKSEEIEGIMRTPSADELTELIHHNRESQIALPADVVTGQIHTESNVTVNSTLSADELTDILIS